MPRVRGFRFNGRPYVRVDVSIPRLGSVARVPFLLDTGADRTVIHARDRDRFPDGAVRTGSALTAGTELAGIGGVPIPYAIEEAEYVFEDEDGAAWPLPGRVHIALDPAVDGIPSLLGRDILDKVLFCISEREITLDW